MSPASQRIAIAEARGWKFQRMHDNSRQFVPCTVMFKPDGRRCGSFFTKEIAEERQQQAISNAGVPDYLSDLNAIHEAVTQQPNHVQWAIFTALAAIVPPERPAACADAAQWSEAFLKTLNLWDDSK